MTLFTQDCWGNLMLIDVAYTKFALTLLNIALAFASLSVLTANSVTVLNPFLKYGKTLKSNKQIAFLNIYVPKYWFTHFYILHTLFSIINIYLFGFQNINDLQLIVLLNLVQSIRRLYECLYVSKFSKTAKIHIFHYLVGLFFYSTINIIPFLENYDGNFYPIRWFQPFTFLSIFIYISIKQYQTHFILSKQKKYTLPKTNLFKYVICPHYFYESLIYLIFFLIRPSLSYALISIWVVINLSISANQSYIFYKSKNEITNEYRIFPFIY